MAESAAPGEYVVVARRYRPQRFEDLVGQEHVARAMANAISTNRVGHAYLFTGARGVGKTSAARILAKALNCVTGPTPTPCNQCDSCLAVSTGNDVDVLEIDGASNRRIEEVRNLRQNVSIRPSRSRFKIYIIDEVHMLTNEAFNALLKTLEEPPEHVKFIFCTTEAEKIPITILSRCQRFDFAGVQTTAIAARLRQIVDQEGVEAEAEALAVLARRANGSMRDSQSLLEQLLAFGGKRITLADVHAMLGTAAEGRIGGLASLLLARDAGRALTELDTILAEGVDVGQLLDQLLAYYRDLMVAAVGCSADLFLFAGSDQQKTVTEASKTLALPTILANLQILDQTLQRLRYSSYRRTLAELAIVRICSLEDLASLSELLASLQTGTSPPRPQGARATTPTRLPPPPTVGSAPVPAEPSTAAKKKADPPTDADRSTLATAGSAESAQVLTAETVTAVWSQVLDKLSDMLADNAGLSTSLAISGPNRLVVGFPRKYTSCKLFCEHPERNAKLESAVRDVTGQSVKIEYTLVDDGTPGLATTQSPDRSNSTKAKISAKSQHPIVARAIELFNARPVGVIEDS